jgi:hypothetical protein
MERLPFEFSAGVTEEFEVLTAMAMKSSIFWDKTLRMPSQARKQHEVVFVCC